VWEQESYPPRLKFQDVQDFQDFQDFQDVQDFKRVTLQDSDIFRYAFDIVGTGVKSFPKSQDFSPWI